MTDMGWYGDVGQNQKQYIIKVMTHRMGLHLVCVYLSTNLVWGIHICTKYSNFYISIF